MSPSPFTTCSKVGDDMSSTERRVSFDNVAEIYDRVRPSYPPAAFSDLFQFWRAGHDVSAARGASLGPAIESVADGRVGRIAEGVDVVEIGPGTGKATRSLLDAGAQVTAVEYGPGMASVLRDRLGGNPSLTVVEGAFETVVLPASGFDVVVSATAFHWIDPAVRVEKSLQLLRPAGVLATLATVQVRSDADGGFYDQGSPIYRKYENNEAADDVVPLPEAVSPPEFEEFETHPGLADATLRLYRWDQTYSTASYSDLLRSYSNMQMMPERAREALIGELCELIDSVFGGTVVRPLVIALAMARKSAPA
jgi:SAM-dependent methyltransferase